jgi:membrane dipeptidase
MTVDFPSDRPLIWDMVLPLAPVVGNDVDLLDRFRASGHGYVSLTVAGDDCGLGEAVHRLATVRADLARRADRFRLALGVDDVLTAHGEGRLAVGLHLEGTECLERDVDVLDLFYTLGIRHAILAFNRNNSAAGGCADLGNVGLSRFGQRVVDRLRTLGMLLDLSHTSERAGLEALERHGGPVVFTHSNVAALHPHYRNLTDAQIRACAESGGLIGISGSSAYLGAAPTLAEGVFRHIDYIVQRVGLAHVGLGTDYVADARALERILAARPDEWPEDSGADYSGLAYLPPEDLARVIDRLAGAGYDAAARAAILGGNWMRVCGAVWR